MKDKIDRFINCKSRVDELNQELKHAKEAKAEAEAELIEAMVDSGMDSLKSQGLTVYMRRDFYASCTGPDGVRACLDSGNPELLQVGSQKFGAMVREIIKCADPDKVNQPEPDWDDVLSEFYEENPAFKGHVNVGQRVKLGHRSTK